MNPPNHPAPPFADDVLACRTAQAAWRRTRIGTRLRCVRAFRRLLVREADRLTAAVERDIARPPGEVLATDLLPTADACRYLERDASRVLAPRPVPWTRRPVWLFGERDVVHHRPHGVVAVIGTWNYPVFLNGVQIVQALTAGNGVLWKPSELVPHTAEVLSALFAQAGYPPDLVRVLPATREAGPLVAEAEVDHVVFTGSAAVGRRLAARLGERLVGSTLELSGCDALFVLADADLKLAAKAVWFGATLNKGQTCLAVRRAFVQWPVYNAFLDELRPLVATARPVALALESQARQAEVLLREAVAAGAKPLDDRDWDAEPPAVGAVCWPTAVCDARPEMAVCREASFAPVLAVIPFHELDDALAMDRTCGYGLGASVFTRTPRKGERMASRLRVGMVSVNDTIAPTGHPGTPFGGRGASGWGVTQGPEGLRAMTVPQVVSVRRGTFRPHYDPIDENPAMAEAMRGLLEWGHAAGLRARLRGLWRLVRSGRRALRRP